MSFFINLLWRHLRQYPGRALAAVLVLAVAGALMLTLAGLGVALQFRVVEYLDQLFPRDRLRLTAERQSLGPLAVEPEPIDDATLDMLRDRADTAAIWGVESIRFPVRVEANLMGSGLSTDAVVHGLPAELIGDAIPDDVEWVAPPTSQGVYPIVISRYFLDMYNQGLARSTGLPMLSPAAVIGRHVTMFLGESSLGITMPNIPSRAVRCRLVGFSSDPGLLGIALPAEAVAAFNREFLPDAERQYVMAVVELAPGADREAFIEEASERKLALAETDRFAAQARRSIRAVAWALIGLGAGVILLGMLTFYTLFALIFHARRGDLIRLRALGMSARAAVALALAEVLTLALLGVAVAVAGVALAQQWATGQISSWADQYASIPPNLFEPAPGALLVAAFVMLAVTLLPALPMLLAVIRVEPADIIRDL